MEKKKTNLRKIKQQFVHIGNPDEISIKNVQVHE